MQLTNDKITILKPYFKFNFLKPDINDLIASNILQNTILLQPQINTQIFKQGDQIHQYFFLIRGIVYLYKNHNKLSNKFDDDHQERQLISEGQVVGEYFNSSNSERAYTAQVGEQCSQILKIQKKTFDQLCQSMIKEYSQVEKYTRQILDLDKQIDSFNIFTIKKFRLGSVISLNNQQIGFIFKGQCKLLYKFHEDKYENQKSQLKFSLPPIKKSKEVIKQIMLLGQNEWIMTYKLGKQGNWQNQQFTYIANSQNTTVVAMSIHKQNLLPINLVQMLHNFDNHLEKRSLGAEKYNIKGNFSMFFNPLIKQQNISSSKVRGKYILNQQLSHFLQKYKLGYNSVRYQLNNRKKGYLLSQQKDEILKLKEKRKLIPLYKVQGWSHFTKFTIF